MSGIRVRVCNVRGAPRCAATRESGHHNARGAERALVTLRTSQPNTARAIHGDRRQIFAAEAGAGRGLIEGAGGRKGVRRPRQKRVPTVGGMRILDGIRLVRVLWLVDLPPKNVHRARAGINSGDSSLIQLQAGAEFLGSTPRLSAVARRHHLNARTLVARGASEDGEKDVNLAAREGLAIDIASRRTNAGSGPWNVNSDPGLVNELATRTVIDQSGVEVSNRRPIPLIVLVLKS